VAAYKGRRRALACGPRLGGVPEADSAVAQEESGSGTIEVGDAGSGERCGRCWAACEAGMRPAVGAHAGHAAKVDRAEWVASGRSEKEGQQQTSAI
jgi:hypothetical protein